MVITTASETADSAAVESRLIPWRRMQLAELTVLHTRSRATADDPEFSRPLAEATGVWFIGGHQDRLTDAYLGTRVEAMIHRVLERGGVVGGTSAGAAIMSPLMIRGGNPRAELGRGFGFLPGTVVDQHFLKRRRQERLLNVIGAYPGFVGIGIDEGTIAVVHGRRLSVFGDSESRVLACLAAVGDTPARTVELEPGNEIDLVALRRSALARLSPRATEPGDPAILLARGTLVVSGGGEIPAAAAARFLEAAGGPEKLIVVVTTAAGDEPPEADESTEWLKVAGARRVHAIHPQMPRQADDPEVLALLREAGGVWFTGGRQWRLVDAFSGTAAEKLLREVVARGGAVGGSAAGASMLASYLVRGSPLSNHEIMAEGYEDGFGLVPGAAIDPFFTRRNRFNDMARLKSTHPHLLGLGVDEGTALVISDGLMEVVGKNHVAVYARSTPPAEGEREFDLLYAGDRYNLRDRARVAAARGDSDADQVADADTAPAAAEEADSDLAVAGDNDDSAQPALICE